MNDNTPHVGIAIIGCGYWGINYVRVFNELPNAQVVVVCEKRPDRLKEIAQRFPDVLLTTEIEDALNMDGVDAALVCTPAATHYGIVRHCLEAGKHVLVEKPITTKVSDAEDLHMRAMANGVRLMVGHTFLYNAAIRKVKDYLVQHTLGRVYYLYSQRTNLGPIRRDVNAVWDLAPHDVSIFNYLLDDVPQWVSAVGAKVLRNCREDVGFISLGYSNDVLAHIHVSWADPNKVREVVVVGSDKRVVFNDLNAQEPVRVFDKGVTPAQTEPTTFGEYQYLMRNGDITSPHIEFSEPLKNQCLHFLECVIEDRPPLTNVMAGRHVVSVMEAIDRSMARHGAPVAVEAATSSMANKAHITPLTAIANQRPKESDHSEIRARAVG